MEKPCIQIPKRLANSGILLQMMYYIIFKIPIDFTLLGLLYLAVDLYLAIVT